MNYSKVKGFDALQPWNQEIFKTIHTLHLASVGAEYKDGWEPVRVKLFKGRYAVTFKNGEWLYYYPNLTWG